MFSTTVFKHIAPLPTLNKACLEYIPTDEILDALAPEIGIISFHLGIELGLRAVDLERIQYRYQHDLVKQAKQVLYDWKKVNHTMLYRVHLIISRNVKSQL
jgi:hypothetical protein